ncbi:MAG: hypothetical protein K8L97_03370 [Anaerolineae bacterium]|nr:hypothetical protein [Anaerolineae bacterium]
MKRILCFGLLLLLTMPLSAQETPLFEAYQSWSIPPDTTLREWSPDGTMLVATQRLSTTTFNVLVYRVATGELIYTLPNMEGWGLNGRVIVSRDPAADGTYLIDVVSGKVVTTLAGVQSRLAWNTDELMVAASSADSIRVYDVLTGEILHTLEGFQEALSWSADSTRLLLRNYPYRYSGQNITYIWTLGEGVSQPIYNATSLMRWSPDGSMIAGGSDYTKIRVWDAHTAELLHTLRKIDMPTYPILWHPTGNFLLAGSGDYGYGLPLSFDMWDVTAEKLLWSTGYDLGSIVDWAEGGVKITRWERTEYVDMLTGEIVATTLCHFQPGRRTSPRAWEALAVNWSENVLRIEDICMNEVLTTLNGHTGKIQNVEWSPDGSMLASEDETTIHIWRRVE